MMVYKYRPWNEHTKKMIEKNQIWFSRISELNDPFECDFSTGHDSLLEFVAENVTKTSVENLKKAIEEKNFDLEGCVEVFRNNFKRRNYIFSASEIPDSVIMWSHYADNHRGVCLGYDHDILDSDINKLLETKNDQSNIVKVNYTEIPTILDIKGSKPIDLIKIKNSAWSYEKEVRAQLHHNFCLGEKGILAEISQETLKEIIVGCKVSDSVLDEIESLAAKCKARIKKATMIHGMYRMQINEF